MAEMGLPHRFPKKSDPGLNRVQGVVGVVLRRAPDRHHGVAEEGDHGPIALKDLVGAGRVVAVEDLDEILARPEHDWSDVEANRSREADKFEFDK